ncbi:YeeE/YedE family protein [Candidatus Bathyarchaeota archaeon]|nr:MAG: YeeE/YedE family protein [Candidatus Bathyarchaeota archaeon]
MIEPTAIITGLIIGILFGFALQRGRFCMNSAFRDIILMKEYTLLKAVVAALIVEMLGFHLMATLGIIQLNPKPFFWGANIVGGFIFGIGMVLAGGCASGTTYRVGEGMVGSFVALLGYMIGSIITGEGALKEFQSYLKSTTKITVDNAGPLVSSKNTSPTLANIFGVHPWIVAIILAIIGIAILAWKRGGAEGAEGSLYEKIFKHGWPWWATGIVIGIIGMLAFPASAAAGRNYPLGITGGWKTFLSTLLKGDSNILSWETFEVIGIVIGAAIAAAIAGELKLRAPGPKRLIQQFIGGLLLGIGAVTAFGCNIGHILSGVPQLALSSILSGFFIIIGAWVTAYLMFMR